MVQGREPLDCSRSLSEMVIMAAINVHRELGPGLLESIYEQALFFELAEMGLGVERQVPIPVYYKDQDLGVGYRADIVVNKKLLLEIKSIENYLPVHTAQLITYLKLTGIKRGLLLNFNLPLMKAGIKRVSI